MPDTQNISIAQIRNELDRISNALIPLIRKYKLDVANPLDIIPTARKDITDPQDYVRFLELSLEGRIYGEVADHLQRAETQE